MKTTPTSKLPLPSRFAAVPAIVAAMAAFLATACDAQPPAVQVLAAPASPATPQPTPPAAAPAKPSPTNFFGFAIDLPEGWSCYPADYSGAATPGFRTLMNLVPATNFNPGPADGAMFTIEAKPVKGTVSVPAMLEQMVRMVRASGGKVEVAGAAKINDTLWQSARFHTPQAQGLIFITDMYWGAFEVGGKTVVYTLHKNYHTTADGEAVTKAAYLDQMTKAIHSIRPR